MPPVKSAGSLKLLRGINASLAISDRAPFLRSRSRAEELWGVCSPPPPAACFRTQLFAHWGEWVGARGAPSHPGKDQATCYCIKHS